MNNLHQPTDTISRPIDIIAPKPSEEIPRDTAKSLAITALQQTYKTLWDPTEPRPIRDYLTVNKFPQEVQQAKVAIEEHDKNKKDPLTGLYNRAALSEIFNKAIDTASVDNRREKQDPVSISIIFADLDGFKAINDGYGHEDGDKVLIEVAGRMQDSIRDTDSVFRLGGDEFVVLMSGISEDDTKKKVEEIKQKIEEPINSREDTLGVGASMGVVTLNEEEVKQLVKMSPEERLKQLQERLSAADERMYADKKNRKKR